MAEEKKLYAPFDGQPERRFPLKKTSKGNIRALADVCSKRIKSDDSDRASWAEQAGHDAIDYITVRTDQKTGKREKFLSDAEKKEAVLTESKKPIYQVEDVFNEYYIHAALAPVLFDGFPRLLEVTRPDGEEGHAKIVVIEPDLFDNLLEDVVNEAFLAFAGKRNPTSHLLNEFLKASNGDPGRLVSLLAN